MDSEIQQQSLYTHGQRDSAPRDPEELSNNAVLDDPEILASEGQKQAQDHNSQHYQQLPSTHFADQIPNTIKIISLEGHEIEQPYRITQMCRRINSKIFSTDIKFKHLQLIVNYCEQMHYVKNTTTLQFPLAMNNLEDNTGAVQEMQYIKEYVEDFQSLKELMRAAKTLGTEAFYQLCAAAIASWFRRKTMRDVNKELGLERPGQFEPPLLTKDEIINCKSKFKFFLDDVKYPQLPAYDQARIQSNNQNQQNNQNMSRAQQEQYRAQHQMLQQQQHLAAGQMQDSHHQQRRGGGQHYQASAQPDQMPPNDSELRSRQPAAATAEGGRSGQDNAQASQKKEKRTDQKAQNFKDQDGAARASQGQPSAQPGAGAPAKTQDKEMKNEEDE